jgi:hypothetical protein
MKDQYLETLRKGLLEQLEMVINQLDAFVVYRDSIDVPETVEPDPLRELMVDKQELLLDRAMALMNSSNNGPKRRDTIEQVRESLSYCYSDIKFKI